MEVWRDVVGYEGFYKVSNTGRVISPPRAVRHYTGKMLIRAERELRGSTQMGYLHVTLTRDGIYSRHPVHRLVAAAFIGPRPEGALICHCDGNPKNNNASNLRYDTPQGNSDDMSLHGTVLKGQAHGMAKLTESEVLRIRDLAGAYTQSALAKMFGVSPGQIWNILRGRQWRHLSQKLSR